MYNGGYGGNPSGFSIQNYAPIDPMAGMPGFPAAPVPPPQAQQGSAANAQRSQSSNVNTGGRSRVSTEEMRRDYAQSAVYIPTPINNMNTGPGCSMPPASQRQPTQSANQMATNPQGQRAVPQNLQMNQVQAMHFMQQQQTHQIQNGQRSGPTTSSQNILASLQGVANQPMRQPQPQVQVVQQLGAPGVAVQQQRNQRPPGQLSGFSTALIPQGLPPLQATTRVQETPEIYVFNPGHAYYDNTVFVNNQYVNLLHFFDHVVATNMQISDVAALEIRSRLPVGHRFRIPRESLLLAQVNARQQNPQNQPTTAPPRQDPNARAPHPSGRANGQGPQGNPQGPMAPNSANPGRPHGQGSSVQGPTHLGSPNQQMMPINFPQGGNPFQYPWPMNGMSQEDLHRHQQSLQNNMQLIHQHAQQMVQFHPNQQLQQANQSQQRRQEHPNHQQIQQQRQGQQPQAPLQETDRSQPIQVATSSRVGISADERAPPCAYSPVHSPSPVAAAEEPTPAAEVKPVPIITEKPKKKKTRIEVITLDEDAPLVRVKTEPVNEVSSTSDAPPPTVNVKQEPDRLTPQERTSGDQQPRSTPSEAVGDVIVKPEPLEQVRRIVEQNIQRSEEVINPQDPNTQKLIEQEAIKYLRIVLQLPRELRPEGFRDIEERTVQESHVTTTGKKEPQDVKEPRSRSSSESSDIIAIRPKKKVIHDDDELSDDPYEADQPCTSAGPVSRNRSRNDYENTPKASTSQRTETPRNEQDRREKRPVAYDYSDDDMPAVQKRKRGSKTKSSSEEEEEEWKDDGNHSSEGDEDYVAPDDYEEEEEVVEDDMKNFIVEDDEDSDENTRRRRKDKKKDKDRSWRPPKERTRSPDQTHSKRAEPEQRARPVDDHRRRVSEPISPPQQPLSDEARKRLRRQKNCQTREENREKRRTANLEKLNQMSSAISKRAQEVPHSSAIKEYHQTIKRDPKPRSETKEKQRGEKSASDNGQVQKRTTPSASSDPDDEGVHVPTKRMAHANSVPGTSRDRTSSNAAPVRNNRPSQQEMDKKRYAEAEAKREKDRREYEGLKKKQHPTEGERMRLMHLKSLFEPKPAPRPATSKPISAKPTSSKPSTSASATMKKVVIKKEFPSEQPPPRPPTPPLLEPAQGRMFAADRKRAITSLYNYLIEAQRPNPSTEAQRIELELAKKSRDPNKYKAGVRSKLAEIKRNNPAEIMEINPNAVSHSQILTGAPKDNCLVAKGRRGHIDYRILTIEQLQPLLVPFKMSDSELETNAYPLLIAGSRMAKIAETTYTLNKKMFLDAHDLSRSCSRCQKEFKLNPDGTMVREEAICRYHHRGTNRNGKRDTFQKRYTCCNEDYNSTPGCKFSDVHVFDQLFKKELATFVPTPLPSSPNDPRSNKAYAIDCEMVYTISGPALARLTMVNMRKEKVLDLYIKPPTEVLDPNTEFSGLTMEDIQNAQDTMETCHQKLFKLVNSETILIGHSLESDLKAMRIVHKSVIDTAILFRSSGDFKIALKNLSSKFLGKTIQGDNEDAVGHDSLEDANTCVDLIFHGLKNPECIVIRKLSS